MAENSRPSTTLTASPASMATRIRICRDGASFVQMEFFLSYGVVRNKGGNVPRWLWNHVSISRISSPEEKKSGNYTEMRTSVHNSATRISSRWGEKDPVINPLTIKFHIHSQHLHARFLHKHTASIQYDYEFIKNTAFHTDWPSFINLKSSKIFIK